jgi:toxin ParE1/3/4
MNWFLSSRANLDLSIVLAASDERFGPTVRARYRALLQQAIQDVADDPRRAGVKAIAGRAGAWAYHTRHARPRTSKRVGRPRHVIVFRIAGDRVIILRILHDAMDLPAWLQDL